MRKVAIVLLAVAILAGSSPAAAFTLVRVETRAQSASRGHNYLVVRCLKDPRGYEKCHKDLIKPFDEDVMALLNSSSN